MEYAPWRLASVLLWSAGVTPNSTLATLIEPLFRQELSLFVYVFVEQIGIPVPAVPVLLATGALVATGKLSAPMPSVSPSQVVRGR